MVAPRSSLVPFLAFSLALHLLLLSIWPNLPVKERTSEKISVSLLPESPEKKSESSQALNEPRTRHSEALARESKKISRLPQEIAERPRELVESEEKRKAPDQQEREKDTIVQRRLPTLKELLPPVTWSQSSDPASNKEGAVRLDTREPKYVSYFTSIKRAIELAWEYPEPALRQGLQGKLVLEFTILGNGQLERMRVIRSSGFSVLDQEAVRAVQAASPFHPIPPWIGKNRLDVVASFEYYDNRLKYGFAP